MLNRLFIVIGVLAILALSAAFVVPRFIQWGDYRGRMEEAATAALGAPVTITGDIHFALLPQPELNFSAVVVGPGDKPVLRIAHVMAQFSLMDFIRDQYTVTKLVLDEPILETSIAADGRFDLGIALTDALATTNVTIESADIVSGIVTLADARSGRTLAFKDIAGELKISGDRGPFAFQGSGTADGQWHDVRFTTAAIDETGKTSLSVFARPTTDAWSLTAEGQLTLAADPTFAGELAYEQKPAATGAKDDVRGNLVVLGKVEASSARVLLSAYTLTPDENRAATRLTGAAEITLSGAAPKFNAVISGGVLALPPRDATAEETVAPYELVRLLAELPAPPVPPIAGTINADIAELNLRAVSVRNVRLDAKTDGAVWELTSFTGQLPGNTALKVAGAITVEEGHPRFIGDVSLKTTRLDLLAQQWRKPAPSNPLFNVPATLTTKVSLGAETLVLTGGALVVDGLSHAFGLEIGFGQTRRVDLTATLASMDDAQSAAIGALLPEIQSDASFGVTFPRGRIDLAGAAVTLYGVPAGGLAVSGGWEGGVLEIKTLAAQDFGGAAFNFGITAFGTFARPELSGHGTLKVSDAKAPALGWLFERLGTPMPMQDLVRRSLPADLDITLEPPSGDGSQTMNVTGIAGVATVTAQALLGAGLPRAIGATIGLGLDLVSTDATALSAQIGLGTVDILPPGAAMRLGLVVQGNPANSLETSVVIEGGGDSIGFAGNVVVYDPKQWTGRGIVKAALSEPSALAEAIGAGGVSLPALSGSAELSFTGADTLQLSAIEATSGGQPVTGSLKLALLGDHRVVSGELEVGAIPASGLVAALVGPVGMIGGDGIWPEGPIDIGYVARDTTGRVRITTPSVTLGEGTLFSDVGFDLDWDSNRLRLRDLKAVVGGGTLALDATICCAGGTTFKTLTGRIVVTDADIKSLLPSRSAAGVGGTIDLNAEIEGSGDSLATLIGALTGEGSFAVDGLEVEQLDPRAFFTIGALDNIPELAPDALADMIGNALAQGPFTAPNVSGHFILAGGALRSPNFAVETADVRFHGGGTVRLEDLALDATYTLAPKGPVGTSGLISDATSEVVAHLGGTLLAPDRTFDVAAMVDAVQVKALEIELAELERLRAEDEARAKAAAAERARIAAERAKNYAAAAVTAVAEVPSVSEALARSAAGQAARRAAEAALQQLMTPAAEPQRDGDTLRLNLTPGQVVSRF